MSKDYRNMLVRYPNGVWIDVKGRYVPESNAVEFEDPREPGVVYSGRGTHGVDWMYHYPRYLSDKEMGRKPSEQRKGAQ